MFAPTLPGPEKQPYNYVIFFYEDDIQLQI